MLAGQVRVKAVVPSAQPTMFKRTLIRHMQAGGHREMPPGSVWSPEHDGGDDIVETEITPLRSQIQEDGSQELG